VAILAESLERLSAGLSDVGCLRLAAQRSGIEINAAGLPDTQGVLLRPVTTVPLGWSILLRKHSAFCKAALSPLSHKIGMSHTSRTAPIRMFGVAQAVAWHHPKGHNNE
jgi:hypothetical protein